METLISSQNLKYQTILETFLGGMETGKLRWSECRPQDALKPSLVEWKPGSRPASDIGGALLETFLGGMETSYFLLIKLSFFFLETFLGGMETSMRSHVYKVGHP